MSEVKQKSDDLISRWERAKAALDTAKNLEMSLREEIVAAHFLRNDSGTYHYDLPDGRDLVCVRKLNYKFDNRDAAWAAQEALRPRLGAEITARLVKWSPELSLSEYKLLDDDCRAVLAESLTIKPATPTLELRKKK